MAKLVPYVGPAAFALASILIVMLGYTCQKYLRLVVNLFLGVQINTPPEEEILAKGERVTFKTRDGVRLSGVLIPARGRGGSWPLGTMVFSHEFGSDKNSCMKYAGFLLDAGFRIFAFDYRNHGESDCMDDYEPRHWFTDHEVGDLEAALDYLSGRDDVRPDRIGLFGISRGASVSLCVASRNPSVFVVVSDSAFSTYRTLIDYERKWVSIFAKMRCVYRRLPMFVYTTLGKCAMFVSRVRLGATFPSVERALPECKCPVLFVHGRRDTYIDWQQAVYLAELAGGPCRTWIVPEAKHNHSRFVEPGEYEKTVTDFVVDALPPKDVQPSVAARSGT